MLRICKILVGRSLLQPRVLDTFPPAAGVRQKQTIEEKLGIPDKPKRPVTPYFRFLAKVRPILAQKFPDAKVTDIARLGGDQWAKADPALKQQMEEEYKKEKIIYDQQKLEYDQSISKEQKEEITKAKKEENIRKEKRKLQKKMKDLGKPKRPLSAFMAYMLDISRKEGETYRDFQVRMGKQWETENETIKAKYIDKFNKQMEIYRREITAWEEKMIRLGHIDVVRNEALIEPRETQLKRAPSSRTSK